MKKVSTTALVLIASLGAATAAGTNTPTTETPAENVGWFEAEGKKIEVKFVRVLYAAEGSERPGESNSVEQLVFDSKDPQGKAVKVFRYQITAKNTGYDEVQQDKEEDFKMKSVTEGVKLHIEVPLDGNGKPQFDKAWVGNLAYNFGTRETRHNLSPATVSDLKLKINKIDLPVFGADHKPGDNGVIYHQGFIDFTLSSKAKHIDNDDIAAFNIHISGPITLTHVRGKERQGNAVSIDAGVVGKNIR